MEPPSESTQDEARARHPDLHYLDREKARLEAEHPGWRIWYVPNSHSGLVTWCAQPLPTLNAYSPKELTGYIREASASAPTLGGAM
jgi:hypothetical protein